MSCTNCFSGCVSTTSDKCVKYTGNSVAFLNISTGDTLESVEKAITDYLATVFSGEGIEPVINPAHICDVVSQYFPCAECGEPTLVDILTAVIRAICDIEDEIAVERARIDVIEAPYTTDCISVDGSLGTHSVLQGVIVALCDAIGDIATLNNLFSTCITTATINEWIAAYLNSITTDNMMYTKMVPYVVYPFYPNEATLGQFAVSGAGMGVWTKVYLCNGANGTPDLRGRSLIGVTNVSGGGAYDSAVDPATNPSYTLGQATGQNSVVLTPSQMAAHTHVATAEVTDPGHVTKINIGVSTDYWEPGDSGDTLVAKPILKIESTPATNAAYDTLAATTVNLDKTGISVDVTNAVNTGGESHTNVHPVFGVYYIIYIPS